MTTLVVLALAGALAPGCSAGDTGADPARVGNVRISGQPDAVALGAAKASGVTTIVNLREPGELDWDEAGAARDASLAYHSIPVSGRKELAPEAMERISDIVSAQGDAGVLVHCASGNRAAAWLAIDLVTRRNMTRDEALVLAERAGLTKTALRDKVERYLDRQAAPALDDGDVR